ncbi:MULTISPECIES: SPOR domain-containing protein [Vibrio]|uniref:SPOR domain-containing protein n=1 Tax=Vibrio casei TaxID=673372 RepID=A0A368LNV8_9VIBR|nr:MULTISPECIES: SPOR domain-containing protein [Vibrio]RCS73590.1 SPOR domain-containing protein [Vibrio casei]SJN31101.1 DedD protein [Vibrio casei]HBV76320.1 SPOR domain-containing protein [Vibrio sp.]
MASKFQSRLIGTVILVAIGVIVLPDVFDGQKKHYQEEFAAIPIKPTDEVNELVSDEVKEPVELDVPLPKEPVPVVTVQSDQKSESIEEPKKTVTAQVADQEDRSEVKDVSEPKIIPVREKNKYADSAWIIQLVALKNQDNAKKLVTDLQKRGFQAHLKPDNGLSRVIIGPDVSKEKLEQQIDKLQKITGLKGQLQTFKPLNP